ASLPACAPGRSSIRSDSASQAWSSRSVATLVAARPSRLALSRSSQACASCPTAERPSMRASPFMVCSSRATSSAASAAVGFSSSITPSWIFWRRSPETSWNFLRRLFLRASVSKARALVRLEPLDQLRQPPGEQGQLGGRPGGLLGGLGGLAGDVLDLRHGGHHLFGGGALLLGGQVDHPRRVRGLLDAGQDPLHRLGRHRPQLLAGLGG